MAEAKKKTTEKKEAVKKPAATKTAKKDDKKPATKTKVEKTPTLKLEAEQETAAKAAKGGSFIPSVGRRKRAIARVRLIKNGKGVITINGKPYDKVFTTFDLSTQIIAPLKAVGQDGSVDVSAKVVGGGMRGQAEAVRHGIARSLIELNPTFRKTLKKLGYLSRDPRQKERKKPGKKGARRSPQWSKR
ncbi:30S ribosomal protein S9 [Patescibacteria group bacterium]|nr:30S ribosomal protein S9 [Patescibacteria group bacterium]